MSPDVLQWLGCITGVAGSLLLSLNLKYSGWGFVFFLESNWFWFAFGIQTNAPGLSTSQLFFTATSLIGICRWFGFSLSSNRATPQISVAQTEQH
jgi:nicotinamide riboside transporter PnuC